MKPVRLVVLLGTLLGCGHSEPFATATTGSQDPFGNSSPFQLTFSPGDDISPVVATPGELSYQYYRGTSDRDICAALMPAAGGTRTVELCAIDRDEAARSDQFAGLVRLGDGRLVWTHHWSGKFQEAPQSGGLYLGGNLPTDSAIRVLNLMARPAGAADRWDQLLAPVRTGPSEITALAGQWTFGPTIKFGPIDTVFTGVEIVRIDLATNPVTITPVSPAPGAIAWGRDPVNGTSYFAIPTYLPPSDSLFRPIADTIFRASIEGGEPVWGRPKQPDEVSGRVTGFAIANGRLFVARRSARLVPNPGSGPGLILETTSLIAEVVGGSELAPIKQITSTSSVDYWGRLAISTDGHSLIAELISDGQSDLYRLDLTP